MSQGGEAKGADKTDFAGVYYIADLVAGSYLEEVSDLSGTVITSKNITVLGDQGTNFIDFVIADYNPTEALIVVQSNPPGLSFTADGTTYNTPHSFQWEVGSTHTLTAPGTVSDQTLVGWSDGETSATRMITVDEFGVVLEPHYMPSDLVNQYTRTQVTTDATDHKWPSMNNLGDMVWSQKDSNGNWQVYKHGPSTNNVRVPVTSDPKNHERPVISDDGTIAWFQDNSGGGLGYQIVRRDPGGMQSVIEFSSRNFTCNPLTGVCNTPQERTAGKTFGIDSDGRIISSYTFYQFGYPIYRRFNLSGVGKLPEGSASPGNFSIYESARQW